MSLSFFFSKVRLSGRIAGVAGLLLGLAVTEICSAAEVTFGPDSKYSIQLPDSWTATVEPAKKTLGADGPGGLSLNAFVASTATSPEALMEKITTGTTEKKPGYKSIEKGTFKSAAGRKTHAHRYQLDGKSGPVVWVEYYFQLVEKEVVILVFAFPSNISKSPKNEIEAILDSVKVGTTAGKDDSWLESDASPAASPRAKTAPPASTSPTTAGTQVTFATNCSVQLPAGWTAKPPGKYLEGKGPGGVSVDGYSVQAAVSLDEALAQHLSVFEKMPGYELVDTDEISTKAGAEGKLAYYRYNGKSGPVAEVGVIIKAAKNQMVTLRFLAPNAPKKLDANFQSAVEAIFSSLKITE